MVRDRSAAVDATAAPAPRAARTATATRRTRATPLASGSASSPLLAHEPLYVGIDVGKQRHVAGFVSTTLLQGHHRFEGCPALVVDNSREGFRLLADRIRSYTPLEHVSCLVEKTGHYHLPSVAYRLELDVAVSIMHVHKRPRGMLKTDKRDALTLANHLYNQLDRGVQLPDRTALARRALPRPRPLPTSRA
jgi:hypothetical protein